MMTRFVLAALLTSFSGALTTAAEIAPPKQQEILEWFRATGVRWAVYTEYIVAVDSSQSASLSLWASKRNELNKPGFAKLHVSYLAGAIKDADRFQATWSEGIREVLKVPVLSREERRPDSRLHDRATRSGEGIFHGRVRDLEDRVPGRREKQSALTGVPADCRQALSDEARCQ